MTLARTHMHSLRSWKLVALGGLVGCGRCAAIPAPVITPAPELGIEAWVDKRQVPDAISFAQVLLTAIPLSLREIAATNAPAVSSILWEEFLDDKKPDWFLQLPWEIQSYLIVRFGPETAWPTATPQTTGVSVTPTVSVSSQPISTATRQSSRATLSASSSISGSTIRSSATSASRSPTTATSSLRTFSTSTRSSVRSASSASSTISSSRSSSASSTASTSSSTSASSHTSTRSVSSTLSPSPSAASDPVAPSVNDDGLSKRQKIGLGVGIPIGILGLAALLFACGFLCRRRRRHRRHINGTEPPSSPGFIPRFAFQDKSTDHIDHRTPLNPSHNQSSGDLGTMNWEDDGYEPYVPTYAYTAHMATSKKPAPPPPVPVAPAAPMAMHDSRPIMAPILQHKHSSNRARGRRTSYTSLHSVAEEPEDDTESPILGRQTTPLQRKRRPSLPMVLEMPRAATIKRKPIPESPTAMSPAAQAASESLLRPSMRHTDHSGSSSSGLALSTDSSNGGGYHTGPTSPVSPVSQPMPTNPFSNDYSYVEDYGPEYQGGYVDQDGGSYGVHRSLDEYPESSPSRKNLLKTEWPLLNTRPERRSSSPMWDRVYER